MKTWLRYVIAFFWADLLPFVVIAAPRHAGGRSAAGAWKLFILVAGLFVIFWKGFDLRRQRQKYYKGGDKTEARKKRKK